jgi:hypothetical protein
MGAVGSINPILDWIRKLLDWLHSLFRGGGGPIPDDKCCGLARLDNECIYYFGDKSSFVCPEGHHRQWWFCCEGTRQLGCGECTPSEESCFAGPWECSIWWETAQPC